MMKKANSQLSLEELSEKESERSLHWSEKLPKGEMLQPVQLGKQMNSSNIKD